MNKQKKRTKTQKTALRRAAFIGNNFIQGFALFNHAQLFAEIMLNIRGGAGKLDLAVDIVYLGEEGIRLALKVGYALLLSAKNTLLLQHLHGKQGKTTVKASTTAVLSTPGRFFSAFLPFALRL